MPCVKIVSIKKLAQLSEFHTIQIGQGSDVTLEMYEIMFWWLVYAG